MDVSKYMNAELAFCVCFWRNVFLHRRGRTMSANIWMRKRTANSLDWKRETKSILVDIGRMQRVTNIQSLARVVKLLSRTPSVAFDGRWEDWCHATSCSRLTATFDVMNGLAGF